MTHPTAFCLSCALLLTTSPCSNSHTVVRGELPTVAAVLETRPSLGDDAGGNADADDPAIWVHPKTPPGASSLHAEGRRAGRLRPVRERSCSTWPPRPPAPGLALNSARYNNVDLIYGFKLKNRKVDLAVVSDRYNDMMRVLRDRSRRLRPPAIR